MLSEALLELPKITSRTGDGGTDRQAALAMPLLKTAQRGLGPTRNCGDPIVVVLDICGMTWLTVEKLSG